MALPGTASQPLSKVELRISCRKLINKDVTSKSDPCAVLYVAHGVQWIEHGRTENVQNSLDPDFVKAFSIDYLFEEVQKVKVSVYDLDNDSPQLDDDDFLGEIECTLGQIVAASAFQKQLVLKNGKPAGEGKIIIRAEEVKEGGEVAMCTFKARKLDNKDFLGKSDPYLEILRGNPDGSWSVVHRTEVVKNNLNPHWRPFTIPVHTLCGGDKSKPVKFDVYDWDSDGSHDLIGGFKVSVQELEACSVKEYGRTENVKNSLDPDFAKAFTIDYLFEEVQKVKVAVYDLDNSTPKLGDDDFLGKIECTLGQIVAGRPFHKPLLLKNDKPAGEGSIIIRSEEIKEGGEVALFTFRARKLENKDFLGKSDPFLEISKGTSDGSWQVVHRTEVVKNNLNPQWRPFSVPLNTLCGGDKSRLIKFDVFDWDSDGSHDIMGGFTSSVQELQSSVGKEFPVINEHKKAKKKKYENSGYVILDAITVKRVPSFLEYIYGGMQINFTVGVDFTGSNGDPTTPTSLHYINPYEPNEYMQAIQAVGAVCQDYDTDKMFPALGFGAKLPSGEVSHEFAMNFNPQNPFCAGIQGIVQAYQNCVPQIKLWGPTNVAPIIYHVARFAAGAQQEEATKGAHAYFVLLLLTDGVITDMDDTRSAIVHASALPMSIIIVGVGGADFSDMRLLDGDDGVLRAPNGQPVHRDIVQFVPFRDFKRAGYTATSAAELAKHVLAEVPQQVTHYYNWRGMQPNQPRFQQT